MDHKVLKEMGLELEAVETVRDASDIFTPGHDSVLAASLLSQAISAKRTADALTRIADVITDNDNDQPLDRLIRRLKGY